MRSGVLNLFEISDSVSVRRGRHSQKYGFSVQRNQANEERGAFFNGQYSFSNLNQFLTLGPSPAPTPIFVGVLGGTNTGRVAPNWVATAAYVGNRAVHLIRSLDANSAIPVIEPDGTKFFPAGTLRRNPNFGAIRGRTANGNSWYNALQLTLEKRYAAGWGFEAVYTWGKSLSTGDSSFTTLPSQPSNTQDPENPVLDKSFSAFDTRHRLATHFLWQAPRIGGSAAWNRILGHWTVSAIASFSSGYPFSVVDGFNRSRNQQRDASIIADRPDWNPDFRGAPILGDPARWFDPAAFVLQPAGYYGNVPRNALVGPGFANFDLSLAKRFVLGEPHEFEFRVDFFNLTNRPNFATPSSGTGAQIVGGVLVFPDSSGTPAGNAGQIFRTVTDSRQIQFSLRYSV